MNIEKKRIECWGVGKDTIGHISLDKLARPETVKVTLLGEQIIPESFDCYGSPNFTEEQAMLFMFKEQELTRKNGGKYTPLEAEIIYEERFFDVPRSSFDTIRGIEKSIFSLSDLNKMLDNRKMYLKAHSYERLNEFMLWGCFYLDQFGLVMSVEKGAYGKYVSTKDVEDFETFKRNNCKGIILTTAGYDIPTTGSVCPCCGKLLTISDVKNAACVYVDGKFYHDSCWRNYQRLTEIDNFTRCLMDNIYKDTDYHFELLPNGYYNMSYFSHVPWFLFHTIDGDIIMGCRKHVISIEWQENYKAFNLDELFSAEDVTKWVDNGKRGIHASNKEKAFDYLEKVLKTVNPNYSLL